MTDFWPFEWSSACRSEVGNVRQVNEDSVLAVQHLGVWAVADGMGGYQFGDLASQSIVESLNQIRHHGHLDGIVDEVKERLHEVNNRLYQKAKTQGTNQTIGSTVVAFVTFQERCAVIWAGDSRLYLFRSDKLERLTKDHSHVQELVDRGLLSPDKAQNHPSANVITRAVGASEKLHLDSRQFDLQDQDTFLLCSDGLYKDVSETEFAELLRQRDYQSACDGLVDLALSRDCKDNVSVAVVTIWLADKTVARSDTSNALSSPTVQRSR